MQGAVLVLVGTQYYNPQPNLQGGNPTVDSMIVHNELSVGTLTVSGNATFMGSLTVAGNTAVQGTLTLAGHIITAGTQPTVTAETGAGDGAVATMGGNDQSGTITITSGTGSATGSLAKLLFHQAYTKAPRVILTPANADASSLQWYVNSDITFFELKSNNAPADSTTYTFNYWIVE